MEKTIKHIKNYRSGVILILTAVAINILAGVLQDIDHFSFFELFFYIAFSGLMLVGFFVARSANVFGLYMGLMPYIYSLIIVVIDLFSGNTDVLFMAWSILTVIWFSKACIAYAKMPKDIDLGETLPFKIKNQNLAGGHVGDQEVGQHDIRYIEKGALEKDEKRMRDIAQNTKWRLRVLRIARWLTVIVLLENIFFALIDYANYNPMTYHVINLTVLMLALALSSYKPAFAFYLVLVKSIYFDMVYFVTGISAQLGPLVMLIWAVDILFFIFLFFVVYSQGTYPWAIRFRKTFKNLKRNKKRWRWQRRQAMETPEKQDWLMNSVILKDVFCEETAQEALKTALDL